MRFFRKVSKWRKNANKRRGNHPTGVACGRGFAYSLISLTLVSRHARSHSIRKIDNHCPPFLGDKRVKGKKESEKAS